MSTTPAPLEYKVACLRAAGLEAKWAKTPNGTPIIVARDPNGLPHQRTRWWFISATVWDCIKRDGIRRGFSNATLLGDLFSV